MENFETYRLDQTGQLTQAILDQVSTNTADIAQLYALYEALTQNEPVIIQPTDTWPVADPQENVIYRVVDRVNTPPQSYSDYMWNGTAMVLMATYNNAIDEAPTPGSNNLVKSGGVAASIIFDISAYHATGSTLATYADLAAALGTNGANVPSAVRKGGMSVKFVLTSDNKYVQYRLTSNTFTTNASEWQKQGAEVTVTQNLRASAPNWQPNTLYHVGDIVSHDNGNFECVVEHTSASDFTYNQAQEWKSKGNSGEDLIAIGSDKEYGVISAKKLFLIKFFGTSQSTLDVGDIYYNTNFKQLRQKLSGYPAFSIIPFYEGAIYLYNNSLYIWNGTELIKKDIAVSVNRNQTTGKVTITIDNNSTDIIDDVDVTPIRESTHFVRSSGVFEQGINNATRLTWENGGLTAVQVGADAKIVDDNTRTDCVRTLEFPLPQAIRFDVDNPNLRFSWFIIDKNGIEKAIDGLVASPRHNIYVWDSSTINSTDKRNWRVRIVAININGDDIVVNDVLSSVIIEPLNSRIVHNGKQVLIYKFGGEGNDWCFVRTPANYNQFRQKPYPFVICNHGNGWVMDGTPQKANWTKRTMYVPLDDPDYIANPDQYNGTSDESLWYSNPTIEALLAAGYVVCGCENYGDNLYGNENCRKACAAFFEHMVKTYNVEERCCMIGASNGAQTSINAAYLLGGRIKAMILQYPLTCLLNQYNHSYNDEQKPNIRAAYGITNPDITDNEFISVTRTHDVLYTDVVDGKKIGYFPPTKLYYSESDVIVNYQYNTIPLYDILEASLKIVEKVQCSGGHGDYSHFNPSEYVEFFNKF